MRGHISRSRDCRKGSVPIMPDTSNPHERVDSSRSLACPCRLLPRVHGDKARTDAPALCLNVQSTRSTQVFAISSLESFTIFSQHLPISTESTNLEEAEAS